MSVIGIIPIRSFAFGKKRLSGEIGDSQRRALGESLASHVASTAADAGLLPLIVSADPDVAEWSIRSGFPTVDDPSTGLDSAVGTGISWASESRSAWLAIHSDLPLLTVEDLRGLTDALDAGTWPLAPSIDGGTSALGGVGPFETAYGPGSFHRHLGRIPDPRVISTTGLLHDIDSYAALRSAAQHTRGAWLVEYLT